MKEGGHDLPGKKASALVIVIVLVAITSQPSNHTDILCTCPRFSGKFIFQAFHLVPQRTFRLLDQLSQYSVFK